jgi:hypothetical protein
MREHGGTGRGIKGEVSKIIRGKDRLTKARQSFAHRMGEGVRRTVEGRNVGKDLLTKKDVPRT